MYNVAIVYPKMVSTKPTFQMFTVYWKQESLWWQIDTIAASSGTGNYDLQIDKLSGLTFPFIHMIAPFKRHGMISAAGYNIPVESMVNFLLFRTLLGYSSFCTVALNTFVPMSR